MHDNENPNGAAVAERIQVPAVRREIRVVNDETSLAYLLDTARYEHTQRIALGMASASLIPAHLKGQNSNETAANCFLVVNQSLRWGMDPFAVAPETYAIGGKLAYQGKLIAAVVNSRAGLEGRLRYSFDGVGDKLTITVAGRFKGETEDRTVALSVGQAKTQNQMWTKDPEQKLIYSGAIRWARRYCPEVVLGVVTEEDIERISDADHTSPARKPSASLRERLADTQLPDDEAEKVARDAEANRIIEAKAAQAQQHGSPVTSSPAPAASDAVASGGEGEIETDPEAESPGIPDSARTSPEWINDLIVLHKPASISSARAARLAFHAAHAPDSWEKLTPQRQDELHAQLISGSFPWSK